MQNSWLFPYRPFDVTAFLRHVNSPRLHDMPDFAVWIDAAARETDTRAEWWLALAQKEQSFITREAGGPGWQRALDYTMGYGALDSGTDLPAYRGVRKQIFSAARGVRGYLTPGSRFYVGTLVGGTFDTYDAGPQPVPNLAVACAYRYTPRLSALRLHERIWREFGFDDGGEDMASVRDVERIARRICAEFAAGNRGTVTIGRVSFNMRDVAYCSRFVRECCEAALGTAEYGVLTARYFGGSARETEEKLRVKAERVAAHKAVPGDIVCFNAGVAGEWGHIGIHLGNGQFAENTSSKTRGPGFVVSAYDAIGTNRISGFYHLPEFERDAGSTVARLVVVLPGHENTMEPLFHEDQHWVRVRDVAAAFGRELVDHRDTDGKLYITEEATQ